MQKAIVTVTITTNIVVNVPDEFVPDDEGDEERCQRVLFKHLSKNEELILQTALNKRSHTLESMGHYGWNSTMEKGDLKIKKEYVVVKDGKDD